MLIALLHVMHKCQWSIVNHEFGKFLSIFFPGVKPSPLQEIGRVGQQGKKNSIPVYSWSLNEQAKCETIK